MENSIPSLEGLFVTTPSSFDDDASTKVGDVSDEDHDINSANRDLQFIFEGKMRENAKVRSHCHSKVAVLLIDWEKKSEGYLDTAAEVNRLGKLFKQKYGFAIRKKRLNTDARQPVSMQMEKFLVEFKYEFDGDDTLLIIYYAGHGLKDKAFPGQLTLHGSTTRPLPHIKKVNYIVWNQVEERIKETKADLLLIFDCCYAGELAKREKRGRAPGKIFDFFGGSGADERAWGPGPNSFTTALTWALNEFADLEDGFTLHELQIKVQSAPNFQEFPDSHHQVPCVGDRGEEPALQRLKICPLRETPSETEKHRDELAQSQPARPRYYLNLELLFATCPTDEDTVFLVERFREIIDTKNYPLQHVFWRGLSLQNKWRTKWRDAAQQVVLRSRKGTWDSPSPRDPTSSRLVTSLPTVIVESPVCEEEGQPSTSGDRITIWKGSASPKGFKTTDEMLAQNLRQTEKQNYFYATVLIQRQNWTVGIFVLCFTFTLGYILSEHHALLLPANPAVFKAFGFNEVP